MRKEGLNIRQERFAIAYAHTGNATQAAVEAGYKPSRARQTGDELVSNSDIAARVEIEKARINEQLDARLIERMEIQRRRFIEESDLALDALHGTMAEAQPNSPARVMAAIAILDRAGHGVAQKIEANVTNHDAIADISDDKRQEALLEAAIATGKVARLNGAGG